MTLPFSTEEEMVKVFLYNSKLDIKYKYLDWNMWETIEMEGLFGIPDVVMAFGKVSISGQKIIRTYAFELKLRNWKRALVQAFRYSAFSHYSIVVLDDANIQPALSNLAMFQRSNIGLLTLDRQGHITWYNEPKYQEPYSSQLYKTLSSNLSQKLFN